jgi:hypothetical protein
MIEIKNLSKMFLHHPQSVEDLATHLHFLAMGIQTCSPKTKTSKIKKYIFNT